MQIREAPKNSFRKLRGIARPNAKFDTLSLGKNAQTPIRIN